MVIYTFTYSYINACASCLFVLLFFCDCLFVGGFPCARLQQSFIKYIFNVHHVQDDEQTHSDEANTLPPPCTGQGLKERKEELIMKEKSER